MTADVASARERALRLLAQREHSAAELERKLGARGFPADIVRPVIDELRAQGLQSDRRFAESYVHHRIQNGFGPLHIRRELNERGIAGELADECIETAGIDWKLRIAEVRARKFGDGLPSAYREQAKQSRFLYARGFPAEEIRRLFRADD